MRGGRTKNFYGSLVTVVYSYHVIKFGSVLSAELRVRSPAMKKNAEFSEGG